jgi:hypothetical protein
MLVLVGCGRSYDLRGPAPAGALECVRAHSELAGYEVVEGGVGAQSLTLVQPIEPRMPDELVPAAAAPRPLARTLTPPAENRLVVRVVGSQLRLIVTGISTEGAEVPAASGAEAHARTILALCTSSPPVLPGPVGANPSRPGG